MMNSLYVLHSTVYRCIKEMCTFGNNYHHTVAAKKTLADNISSALSQLLHIHRLKGGFMCNKIKLML